MHTWSKKLSFFYLYFSVHSHKQENYSYQADIRMRGHRLLRLDDNKPGASCTVNKPGASSLPRLFIHKLSASKVVSAMCSRSGSLIITSNLLQVVK